MTYELAGYKLERQLDHWEIEEGVLVFDYPGLLKERAGRVAELKGVD